MPNIPPINIETQKLNNPSVSTNPEFVIKTNKSVNDILLSNSEINMEKYIGEIRFNPEIDNLKNLKEIIAKALKSNIEFFGDKDIGKIDFNFISSRKEMNEFYGQETEDWIVGTGRGGKVTMLSYKIFDKESNHPQSDFFPVLKHEIAHIFSSRLFGYGGVFINEGVSGYIAEQSYKVKNIDDFKNLYYGDSWSKKSNYPQAYSFIRFLVDSFGKEKLFGLLKNNSVKNNFKQFKEVFNEVYGISFEEVELKWKEEFMIFNL